MLNLRSLLPGDQKAEPGFDDALKVLLAEAGGAIDERAKLLATIAQGQTTLTEAQQELSAAKKRQVAGNTRPRRLKAGWRSQLPQRSERWPMPL